MKNFIEVENEHQNIVFININAIAYVSKRENEYLRIYLLSTGDGKFIQTKLSMDEVKQLIRDSSN
jgi:hypothetical protein